MDIKAYHQTKVFDAAVQFARAEGIIPAPETAHAIQAVIDEALAARESGERRVVLFNFSGHGLLDLGAYDQYFAGRLEDYAYPAEKVKEALAAVPVV
jgi:tryptophan synthase beta chain